MKPCIGCMKCRTTDKCILPEDDAHIIGHKIKSADGLIIGTPTHWGNMSAQLKLLFDRNVPVFMDEKPNEISAPLQHHGHLTLFALKTEDERAGNKP